MTLEKGWCTSCCFHRCTRISKCKCLVFKCSVWGVWHVYSVWMLQRVHHRSRPRIGGGVFGRNCLEASRQRRLVAASMKDVPKDVHYSFAVCYSYIYIHRKFSRGPISRKASLQRFLSLIFINTHDCVKCVSENSYLSESLGVSENSYLSESLEESRIGDCRLLDALYNYAFCMNFCRFMWNHKN